MRTYGVCCVRIAPSHADVKPTSHEHVHWSLSAHMGIIPHEWWAWWNCQHPFQVSSTRYYNFLCNYATPKGQVGYCSSFLSLHMFPWKREPMEIFYQKFGGTFPNKSKMSQIYKRKKILKFSHFFQKRTKFVTRKSLVITKWLSICNDWLRLVLGG